MSIYITQDQGEPSMSKIYTKDNLSTGERNALTASLKHGQIWPHGTGDFPSPRKHNRGIITRLKDAGLMEYRHSTSPHYSGGWVLTEAGRKLALSLSDYESSASRQHRIDTGKYLPCAASEELNPSPYEVGQTVKGPINGGLYKVERATLDESGKWWYDMRVVGDNGAPDGPLLKGCQMDPGRYSVVEPETEAEVDWGQLGPKVAEAAVLLAAGRGDELVVLPNGMILPATEYDADTDTLSIAAIDLIRELVADYEAFGEDR